MGITRTQLKFVVCSAIFASIYVFKLWHKIHLNSMPWRIYTCYEIILTQGTWDVIPFVLSLVLLHIAILKPAKSHTIISLLSQYVSVTIVPAIGKFVRVNLQHEFSHAPEVQEELLMKILGEHKDTKYGKEHGFNNIHAMEDFIKSHPLTGYSHYEEYFNLIIKNGEKSVTTKEPTTFVALTSGTTGRKKYFPVTNHIRDLRIPFIFMSLIKEAVGSDLGRIVGLRFRPKIMISEGGFEMGPISYKSMPVMPFYVTPRIGYTITNERSALYVHALFALADEEVSMIEGILSTLVYSFFSTIEFNWKELCYDIENGCITGIKDLDPFTKITLEEKLQKNPARAEKLRQEFRKGFDGIAKRIWPNVKTVVMLSSGGFAVNAQILMNSFTKGLKVASPIHVATEGTTGLNLSSEFEIENIRYTLIPSTNVFEFIKEQDMDLDEPRTYLMEELIKGEKYEIVMTNWCGLYRYRLGDVIKIVEFNNKVPVYTFCYRRGQMLNICSEKTNEDVFYSAINDTVDLIGSSKLVDYTVVESFVFQEISGKKSEVDHYVLFIEIEKKAEGKGLHIELQFDEMLREYSEAYDYFRSQNRIEEIEVIQIKRGGFQHLKQSMTQETGNQQFKMPRVLRKKQCLELLLTQKLSDF